MPATEYNFRRIAELIRMHQRNELNASSRKELEAWLADNTDNQVMFDDLTRPETLSTELSKLSRFNAVSSLGHFERKHFADESRYAIRRPGHINWNYLMAIAAVIALVVSGVLFFKDRTSVATQDKRTMSSEISPGRSGATLTLANGKKIRLSEADNGELVREAGLSIQKSANGQLVYEVAADQLSQGKLNTLSTANGETYQVLLPDGSRVWLNAASSLTYTTSLVRDGKRMVKLDGEAYFEVAKDKKHPFVVESSDQTVEVIGTHFNINAYENEQQTSTTLLEGTVKVTSGSKSELIRPGQQVLNRNKLLQVKAVNPEDITDWKEGDFFLNHVDFKTAMRKIARWYDVEVVYDVPVPEDLESGGWMSRRNNLSTVLQAIEGTGLAQFRVEGRTVHVYR